MPADQSPDAPRPPRRRRPRQALLTDYLGAPSVKDSLLSILGSGGVRERIEQQLAASPTARLALAIQDLDPGDASKRTFWTHTSSGEQYFTGASERASGDAQAAPATALPAEPRPTPAPSDSFVVYLHETCETKGEDAALDYIYEVFHPLIIKGREFARAAGILSQVNVDTLPSGVLIGLLMTTYAHKASLDTRADFLARVKARLGQLPDGGTVAPYLADLE